MLTIVLRMWRRDKPRYSAGRGRSYRTFARLSDARQYAEGRGYVGIRVTCR